MTENSQININEVEIFENLISKLDKIKTKICNLKDYSKNFDNNKEIKYLEKLNEFSYNLNNLYSCSKDLYDEFIIQTNSNNLLSEQDLNKQKNLLINKKVQNTFLPYMLYLQILLQTNSD